MLNVVYTTPNYTTYVKKRLKQMSFLKSILRIFEIIVICCLNSCQILSYVTLCTIKQCQLLATDIYIFFFLLIQI